MAFNFTDSIQADFEQFDREHPEVWEEFRRFANEALAAGRDHFSADAILHRIRWETTVVRRLESAPKINNNFSSRYARKLVELDERFRGFFEMRQLKSA